MEWHLIQRIGESKAASCHPTGPIGVSQNTVSKGGAAAAVTLGSLTMDECRKVQLELMAQVRRVGALHLAELALEARIEHLVPLSERDLAHVAIVVFVEDSEEALEAIAVLKAHAAAVTDFEDARDLGV
tara:strand:- start:435 stop:821 length:387 start_codon:yes stop_codon:yes gene_type:complete